MGHHLYKILLELFRKLDFSSGMAKPLAALAVIAEKPEMFGRTLIYMGLAEGIAIYGLVMSILLLGKL